MIGLRDVLVVAPAASFHAQHHHGHHHNDAALLSPAEHPLIPLLTAAPCLADEPDGARGRIPTGMNLWQSQPAPQPGAWPPQSPYPSGAPSSSSYLCKPMPMPVLDSAIGAAGGFPGAKGPGVGGIMAVGVFGVGDGVSSSSFTTCQDCGNKAKKDCVHRRCRTCCKSRGFDCSTHLKSTWVPAAQRRERQVPSSGAGGPPVGTGPGSSASTSAAKKPRLLSTSNDQTATTNTTSTSNTTTPRSFDSSSHQDAGVQQSLPGQVRAPAVFKCVRVTTMDDGEDEYAYQAMVRIGGHIFKGFLYDQGVAGEGDANASSHSGDQNNDGGRNNDSGNNRSGGIPNISELHLGGAGGGGGGASDMYVAAGMGGGLMGGTAYGNPIN